MRIRTLIKILASQDGAKDVWVVTWHSRYGDGPQDYKTTRKVFQGIQKAKDFISELVQAQKLLRYSEDLHITLSRSNENDL